MTPRPRQPRRPGFTLVEAAFSVALVSLLAVSGVSVIGAAAKAQRVQRDTGRAQALAGELLTEILQRPYLDPTTGGATIGPDAGEADRSAWDDVDDYHGHTTTPPKTRDGTAIPGYTGWTRSVTVQWVDPSNVLNLGPLDTGLKRVTVTVKDAAGRTTTLVGLRSAQSAYENVPTSQVTYTSGVTVSIAGGTDAGTRVDAAAAPLNQIPN